MFHLDTHSILRLYGSQLLFLPSDKKNEAENTIVLDSSVVKPTPLQAIIEVNDSDTNEKQSFVEMTHTEDKTNENYPPFSSGQKIDWKNRKNAKIVVILHEGEFHNRFLTNGLRFFISDIGINAENINFGIYKEDSSLYNLTDMPHVIGILFTNHKPIDASLYKTKDKIIYIAPNLIALAGNVQLQEELKRNLLEIKNLL